MAPGNGIHSLCKAFSQRNNASCLASAKTQAPTKTLILSND
ncbi:hypothetical protein FOPG_12733 [Fusarium oxysporum f. sp. conglutinans race 2 54008]|uniref:Uncharacterized protein n=1 Tax=Fusarium oxysporum f. sp. conglutinans race 2 54008 TaxID=1089457 RepID=X0IE88_FUSOX|nr:hypothetical protein FOPG_12733 [Fusarium oxysporum f. sp. conglutinans race 2 54008]